MGVEELLPARVEHLYAVVAGVGDVDAIAAFVEHDVLEALGAVGGGGQGEDLAALVRLAIVHVQAHGIGNVDGGESSRLV